MYRQRRQRQAFTLLELMIVLVILVLLFAMVGPRLLGSQKKADIKAARTQIGNLESALNLYAVDMRTFPPTDDGLKALISGPSDERAARKFEGPYLDDEVLPLDPWDNEYQYIYPPEHNRRDFPDIWSAGPDGESDTEDDIVNWRADASGEGGTEEGPVDDQGPSDMGSKSSGSNRPSSSGSGGNMGGGNMGGGNTGGGAPRSGNTGGGKL